MSDHRTDVVGVVRFLGLAGQGLQVLQVSPGVLLVLPHVVNYVGDDHGEPAKHGDQHGIVCGALGQVAQVRVHGQEGPPLLVAELRAAAQHPGGRVVVVGHAADGLLQGAVAVPGVVVDHHARLEPCKGILVHAGNAVVRQVQHLQRGLHAAKGALAQGLHGVVGQVELSQERQTPEDAVGHGGDVVAVQPEDGGVCWQVAGDLLQAGLAAVDVEALVVQVEVVEVEALADAALGAHAGRREAESHEHQAVEEQPHGQRARQPHVQQSHAERPLAAFRPGDPSAAATQSLVHTHTHLMVPDGEGRVTLCPL